MPGNINKAPNPWDWHDSLAGNRQGVTRMLVFNTTGDPRQSHRVQVRDPAWPKDEMPDTSCPWIPVGGNQDFPGTQTASATHGIQPGSMIYASRTGEQDWVGMNTVPNDNQGSNDSQPTPSSGQTKDLTHSAEQYKQKTQPGMDIRQYVGCTTSDVAEMIRDSLDRQASNQSEPNKESVEKAHTPKEYKERQKARQAFEEIWA